jgi:hypothetical protein
VIKKLKQLKRLETIKGFSKDRLLPVGYLMLTLTRNIPKGWRIREDLTEKAQELWRKGWKDLLPYDGCWPIFGRDLISIETIFDKIWIMEKICKD